jgi:polysaccharide biosynthesis protein VpsM
MAPLRLALLLTSFVSGSACAQTREPFQAEPSGPLLRNDVAGSRQPVGSQPTGVRIGGFVIQPSVAVRLEGDTNVLNRATRKKDDVAIVFAPSVKVVAESQRASYFLKIHADVARYASLSSQNSETFGIEANARLALSNKAALFTRLAFDRKIEPRGRAGETSSEGSPAEYDQIESQIAGRTETGALRLTASATASKRKYADIVLADGKAADQDFRETNTVALGLNAEYALPNGATLFATGVYDQADNSNAQTCCDRSSEGGQLTAGIRADLSPLIVAEVSAGYAVRDYVSPLFKDFDGLIWHAKVDWYPTPLLSLSVSSGRRIVNSGVRTVAGIVVTTTSLQLFYEVRRNLDMIVTLNRADENYREINTEASATLIGVEGRYILSSSLAGGLYTRFRDRSSSNKLLLAGGSGIEGGLWLRYSL